MRVQIKEIITQRLQELGAIFDSNAAELLARKASTVAGDLRAALKMCQRSALLPFPRTFFSLSFLSFFIFAAVCFVTIALCFGCP